MLIVLLTAWMLQSAPPPVGVEIYRSEKGLNANALYGVMVDPNGFVWVHTDNGLYRYDGNSFKVAPSTLGREVVLANLVDSTTIAALSFDNTIDLIDIRRLSNSQILSIPDSIKLNSFASTVRRFGDTLYVGTSERRVLRKVGEEWRNLTANTNRHLIERFVDVNRVAGEPIFTSSIGTWRVRENELIPNDTTFRLTSKLSFFEGRSWIAGQSKLYVYDNNRYKLVLDLSELGVKGFVHQVLWRNDDELWVATQRDGLIVAKRRSNGDFDHTQLLPHKEISGLAVDHAGSIWVTTLQNGLYEFNSWFDRFGKIEPIPGLKNTKTLIATENYWITEFEGSYHRLKEKDEWSVLSTESIHYANFLKDDAIIIGQLQSTRVHAGNSVSTNLQESVRATGVQLQPPIKHAHLNGELLGVASPNGVFIFDVNTDELIHRFPNRATSVLMLDSNTIAIGRPNQFELQRLDTKEVTHAIEIPTSSMLKFDSSSFLVAGASGGMHVYNREIGQHYPVFGSHHAFNATWDRLFQLTDSTVAAIGSIGFFVLEFDNFHKLRRLVEIPMTPSGLARNVTFVKRQDDGMVWISTLDGVLNMSYDDIFRPIPPLVFALSELKIDGIEQRLASDIEMKPSQKRLSISLSMFGYLNPGLVVLEYLSSADSDSSWIVLSQPSIEIESIRKGHTTFTFRLRNVLTDEVLSSVSLVVHKAPFWWERPWVIALGLILGILTTVALANLALRRSHRKMMDEMAQEDRVRELERVAITRLLTSHYLFNALATIRSVARRSTDEVNTYIGRLSKVIRALIDRTSQNEVDMRSELDWIHDYVALESVGRQLPLRFDVTMDEDIDPEEVVLPAFILQPIVENAMFHGAMHQDPVIRCDIRQIDRRLHIFIRNRIEPGSSTAETHGSPSKGLAFMTERLKGWGRYHGLHLETDDVLRIRQTDSEWTIEIILPLVNHDLPLVTRN